MVGLASRFVDIRDSVGPLCVGIDPSSQSLSDWGLADSADGALEFARVVLDGCTNRVGIIKPQVAYFERFGSNGFAALETVIAEANSAGVCVIADAKRGDIGTTMNGYASAWLGDGPLGCHAMTVSPYLGFDALEPAFASAEARGSTVFVLAATSNRNAEFIQQVQSNGLAIAQNVVHAARDRSAKSLTVGVVVGATRPLSDSGLTPESLNGLLVLAPGFGAQGALMSDVGEIFGSAADWVIPSVSRSVVANGASGVGAAIDGHRQELGL